MAKCWVLFFLMLPLLAQNQDLKKSSYGVPVLESVSAYKKICKTDSNQQMKELKAKIPSIVYDLRYAVKDNFVKQPLYPRLTSVTFLRLPAANALANVQKELLEKGLGLKIFDAYRPYSVTVKFWELIKDERYVANPSKGSGHNRGLAVDLTIIDLKTGKELDMGTGFDNFTDTAHHTFTALPETVLNNRKLLKEVMLKYGFKLFETEWWHYSWPNDRNYEVMNLSFEKLSRLSN
ncbi:MAG: M15 family metallopeptidase [Chitinophagaceae bacterium]|nr:M15 family metallopeptidase [Chitinophagaceae bacterium]